MVWAAGAALTAAQLNTYAPQETTTYGTSGTILTASTTSPTLGSGSSATASFVQHGKLTHFWIAVIGGSSGTAAGSGTYQFLLPATPRAGSTVLGHGVVQDGSGGVVSIGALLWSSGTVGHLYTHGLGPTTSAVVNLVANRRYLISGFYEAA